MTNSPAKQRSGQPASSKKKTDRLHLPSLHISGFRGIDELMIPKLARVTLLAGDNSVGKTTVLDAVRLYAAQGNVGAISELLESREEIVDISDEDGDPGTLLNWPALFYGRMPMDGQNLTIGEVENKTKQKRLTIENATLDLEAALHRDEVEAQLIRDLRLAGRRSPRYLDDGVVQGLQITFGDASSFVQYSELRPHRSRLAVGAGRLLTHRDARPVGSHQPIVGPGVRTNNEIARDWDNVALTGSEENVVDALEIVLGSDIDGVAVIGEERESRQRLGRRVMLKLKSQEGRIPLKSMGDGAVRLFGLALALANRSDDFLLIDEAENGIHYSHHEDYWRMVIETAIKDNIQVLATTHSFDCIAGFSRAVNSIPGEHGMLIRLDKDEDGKLKVATYTEDLLKITEEMGIEVR